MAIVHQVAVLFSMADKTKPWTCVAGACVEHLQLFFILLSAKERQTQRILKMSSVAFAHLHYISFEVKYRYIIPSDKTHFHTDTRLSEFKLPYNG
jgi:hypothetical protein